ncbi:hypothetical protein BASA81_004144 [Batrachochytrium salamandrivorans]|nr:hypothetical protein BASA81_004144 [Batrachochytrium salamandrivorans]
MDGDSERADSGWESSSPAAEVVVQTAPPVLELVPPPPPPRPKPKPEEPPATAVVVVVDKPQSATSTNNDVEECEEDDDVEEDEEGGPPSNSGEQFDPDSRLDIGLLALLHSELLSSQLVQTAKTMLEEVGLESIAITSGLPPRLKDLVDLWNAFHDEEFCTPKPKLPTTGQASTAPQSARAPVRKRTPPPSPPHGNSNEVEFVLDEEVPDDGEYTGDLPAPVPKKRIRLDSPAPLLMLQSTGNGGNGGTMQRHGPWLVEEEDLLRHALLVNADENLEEITKIVETRSVNGVAKHLQKIKRGWGQMTNKRLCDVLLTNGPTFERMMCVKPIDRTEKEMISWLEWFIFINAKQNPEFLTTIQHEAIDQQEQSAMITWSDQEKLTLRQILEETDVELLDRFSQRFPEPQIVSFCQQIEQQPPLSAQDAKKKRKTKKAVQGRWTIEEGVAFEKVFKETPRNFRALCDAVPLRSRESVALRIRRLNGDPNPRKRSNILNESMLDLDYPEDKSAAAAAAATAPTAHSDTEWSV